MLGQNRLEFRRFFSSPCLFTLRFLINFLTLHWKMTRLAKPRKQQNIIKHNYPRGSLKDIVIKARYD